MEKIFLYGAGGQGKVVIDALRSNHPMIEIGRVVDDDEQRHGKSILGHRATAPTEIGDERGFISIGDNASRMRIAKRFEGRLIVIVHASAVVAMDVTLGEGTILSAGSIVAPSARIGRCVIVNTGTSIDHDSVIEDGVHIAPGSRLCGNVRVGQGSLLGAGTIVVPGVRIGRNAFIHAGQTVTKDVADGETVRAQRSRPPAPTERNLAPDPVAP
ncbi:MAG TPA: acetyltransferase [Planctomycetota bacterium]|nr:acetyltransferase [Planctomycetota bacterium]